MIALKWYLKLFSSALTSYFLLYLNWGNFMDRTLWGPAFGFWSNFSIRHFLSVSDPQLGSSKCNGNVWKVFTFWKRLWTRGWGPFQKVFGGQYSHLMPRLTPCQLMICPRRPKWTNYEYFQAPLPGREALKPFGGLRGVDQANARAH